VSLHFLLHPCGHQTPARIPTDLKVNRQCESCIQRSKA
jgi:hypothetical protein